MIFQQSNITRIPFPEFPGQGDYGFYTRDFHDQLKAYCEDIKRIRDIRPGPGIEVTQDPPGVYEIGLDDQPDPQQEAGGDG